MLQKGIIALDIDGTITAKRDLLEYNVKKYLESLSEEGWQLVFITGRTFSWSHHLLKELSCPYLLAVQNGALIFSMPKREILFCRYLKKDVLPALLDVVKEEETGFVIYSGAEFQDRVFYSASLFSKEELCYLQKRAQALAEVWEHVEDITQITIAEFASVRIFANKEKAERLSKKITDLQLYAPMMIDSVSRTSYIVQVTSSAISKGKALDEVKKLFSESLIVIACGDDLNDIPMLEKADIRVVMQGADPKVLQLADIIAPKAEDAGIIKGLQQAISGSLKHICKE